MKIATWNVNSMKVRQAHVLEWLQAHEPDILVLQEIKQLADKFPTDVLRDLGYESVVSGQKTYNGVAVVSNRPPGDPVMDFDDFDDPQRRVLASTIGDIRVVNLYVPNGSEVGSEKYAYKLRWLAALKEFLRAELQRNENLVVLGDFNIAPADDDVYDAGKWGEAVLCSPPERAALAYTDRSRPRGSVQAIRATGKNL